MAFLQLSLEDDNEFIKRFAKASSNSTSLTQFPQPVQCRLKITALAVQGNGGFCVSQHFVDAAHVKSRDKGVGTLHVRFLDGGGL